MGGRDPAHLVNTRHAQLTPGETRTPGVRRILIKGISLPFWQRYVGRCHPTWSKTRASIVYHDRQSVSRGSERPRKTMPQVLTLSHGFQYILSPCDRVGLLCCSGPRKHCKLALTGRSIARKPNHRAETAVSIGYSVSQRKLGCLRILRFLLETPVSRRHWATGNATSPCAKARVYNQYSEVHVVNRVG